MNLARKGNAGLFCREPPLGQRSAFTLPEALLALVLGTMTVTAAASIALHSVRTRHDVEDMATRRWTRLRALEAFRCDLESVLSDAQVKSQATDHPADLHELIQISALARVTDGSTPFAQRLPARITYLGVTSLQKNGALRLIRRTRSLVQGTDHSTEEVLADELYDLQLERFSEGRWETAKTVDRKVPVAVRLSFRQGSSNASLVVCTIATAEPANAAGIEGREP
jgi:type II secretory pathway pseudopilin PulG